MRSALVRTCDTGSARLDRLPAQRIFQSGLQCGALHAGARPHRDFLAGDADGGARFAVADTGYGIPAEHLPRITERFYRVSTSRSRETGGTGLGLSIVKHVLQLHQAQLTIESEVGVGSTFACVFGPERVAAAFESLAEEAR